MLTGILLFLLLASPFLILGVTMGAFLLDVSTNQEEQYFLRLSCWATGVKFYSRDSSADEYIKACETVSPRPLK